MRRTGRTPIDDDAEKAETRPLEASMPLSIKGIFLMISSPVFSLSAIQHNKDYVVYKVS